MNKIVIISGYPTHGKSEFVKQARGYNGYEIVELSTIDWIKDILMLSGWNGKDKTDNVRKALSQIKTALEDFNGSPSNKVLEKIQALIENYKVKNYIFFVNIREPNRIEEFKIKTKKKLNIECVTLFIENPFKNKNNSNQSDAQVEKYKYDYYILNNGTLEDLKNKSYNFLDIILQGDNKI